VGVKEGASSEGAAALIQEYIQELKRENSLDVSGAGKFTSKTNIMNDMEDIILPVFGAANNLQIDQMGGDVDIHYIVDIEELRNQLATALRIPLPLLAGYAKEAPPALGDGSFASLDIRFSRQCYRLQRAIIAGITRLIQLHLAFTGRDPDLNLFEVHMASVSTAEEQAIRESLDKGVEITEKLIALVSTALGEDGYDKLSLLKYANDKFLKLNDLDFKSLVKNVEAATGPLTTPEVKSEDNVFRTNLNMAREQSSDLKAFTVLNESVWKEKYSGIKIEVGGEA